MWFGRQGDLMLGNEDVSEVLDQQESGGSDRSDRRVHYYKLDKKDSKEDHDGPNQHANDRRRTIVKKVRSCVIKPCRRYLTRSLTRSSTAKCDFVCTCNAVAKIYTCMRFAETDLAHE